MKPLIVDLARPPGERWRLTASQQADARALIEMYKADLGLGDGLPVSEVTQLVAEAGALLVPRELGQEMEGLAEQLAVPYGDVLVCNLYYDAIKAVMMGCTAFAVDRSDGPLHARNLDWWSNAGLLGRATLVSRFVGAPAGAFVTVGWPGFIGTMSGVAPGRFAVTLNSVLSLDRFELATPVVFLLRDVLATAETFDEACQRLTETPIASDCLLLLSGARSGELAVIERTPSRHAIRHATNGVVAVTNDYRVLTDRVENPESPIGQTSCGRFERITELLRTPPRDAGTCMRYLEDAAVRMALTMQHMVFHAASGEVTVALPPTLQR